MFHVLSFYLLKTGVSLYYTHLCEMYVAMTTCSMFLGANATRRTNSEFTASAQMADGDTIVTIVDYGHKS